jgi:cyclopropane-fatty-acyl-phospholipid synthase
MMTKGQLGLCEGYIKNHWQSDNLTNIFTFFLLNKSAVQRYYHANKYFTTFARIQHHILKRNSKKGSRNNIMAHYDLGNDFYQSWLDHSMTYSSALFKSPDDSLETAQYQKMDALIAALDIQPHHHILEIGCGWGGLSAYIAEKTGCKIHAITISPSQHAYAKSMIHEKGLSDQVHVEIRDYRDIVGEYDRIVSVEMIEAVGQDYWQTYFNTLSNHLKNNGKAVLQAITIRDDLFPQYQKTVDFIQAYIFPGGMLPTPKIIEQHAKNAGLSQINSVSFGMDYAHTLRHWYDRFQSAWIKNDREIATKFDAEFKNIWDLYLCYCEAGFKEGNLDVIHVTLQK